MPEARGDIREIVGQPVFVPLFNLFVAYGGVFRLSFGPKSFVIVSDPAVAKQILVTNAAQYSKGILSEILDFVMGKVSNPDTDSSCFQEKLIQEHRE
jgi:beta-ring hydroxylase